MKKKYPREIIDLARQLSDEEIEDIVTIHNYFKDIQADYKSAVAARDKAIEHARDISRVIDAKISEITATE